MLKKSHRIFSFSLLPLTLIPVCYHEINSSILFFDNAYKSYANFLKFDSIESIFEYSVALLFYFLGSTFPDIDMKLKFLYGSKNRYKYHRQFTHSLVLWIVLILFLSSKLSIYNWLIIPLMFSFGVLTHLIGDMITGSIPWFLYGPYYMRFSRIGITTLLPKNVHKIFTEVLPKWLNSNLYIFSIVFIFNLFFLAYICWHEYCFWKWYNLLIAFKEVYYVWVFHFQYRWQYIWQG